MRCSRPGNSTARGAFWNGCCAKKMKVATRLFELADAFADAGQDAKSVEILLTLKRRMFADKKQSEFTTQVEELGAKHPESLPILEFWAALYNELNRESQYFEVLIRLFDANFNSGNFAKASEVLERLVDIDSYDYRNQERMEKLRGHVDEPFFAELPGAWPKPRSVTPEPAAPPKIACQSRDGLGQIACHRRREETAGAGRPDRPDGNFPAVFVADQGRGTAAENCRDVSGRRRAQSAAAGPVPDGELVAEELNPNRKLRRRRPSVPVDGGATDAPTGRTGTYTADTLRDLTKISEINQKTFRQQTPRAMLNTTVTEVGTYLKAARTLAVIGAPGRPPEMAAEYCASGLKPAPGFASCVIAGANGKGRAGRVGRNGGGRHAKARSSRNWDWRQRWA